MTEEKYRQTVAAIRNGTAKPFTPPEYKSPYDVFREIDDRQKAGLITREEAEQEWHDWLDRDYRRREW